MLKRRDFLRATLISAGAALLPGCGGDPELVTTPPRELTEGTAFFPQGLASGDPRSDSVILWARVEDKDAASQETDTLLEVEVSTDKDFKTLVSLDDKAKKVTAQSKFDHCVKVRLTELKAATVYYYRFIYTRGDKHFVSPVGRTKTAPAADADVAVKFAFVSCQDFIGRFYNSYVALAEEDIDFFVHLGDYIYETTGDPTFQNTTGRTVKFTDEANALSFGDATTPFFAARSLDNYRELYKTYRSDQNLQKVHLLFPMIAIWDDHEYSNDCHGAVAAYTDGRTDERDEARRKAANQAWFEYQPVDFDGAPDFVYDPKAAYPDDIKIYRDFVFGKHVHLVMTDLRTYRADHLIPEDAFPGEVVLDKAALTAELGEVPDSLGVYIDIDTYQGGLYKTALTGLAAGAGFDAGRVKGKISVAYINQLATQANPKLPPTMQIPLILPADQATLDKGIAYYDIGKLTPYSAIGARYFVVKDTFDLYGKIKYKASAGASEDVLGKAQESWFLDTIKGSKATWKVWGNEYTLNQLAIDLSPVTTIPAAFQRSFYLNVDDWNGFRNKRSELLGALAAVGGVVALSGDIHACYAGTPAVDATGAAKIVEFVGTSITSATFKSELKSQVRADPVLGAIAGAELLAENVDNLLKAPLTNPFLGFANSGSNGYAVVTADGEAFAVTVQLIPDQKVTEDFTGKAEELRNNWLITVKLRTVRGGSDLYQEIDGAWKKWDAATQAYV